MKILVIGCGSIGQRHIRNLTALGIKEILAFDIDPKRLEQTAQIAPRAAAGSDLEALLKLKPDAAVIALPTSLHVSYALRAARAGCHLFIEKPLSHNLNNLARLSRVVRSKKLITFIGYNFRFDGCLRRLRAMLDQGRFGKIVGGKTHFGSYLPERHPGIDYRKEYGARRSMGGGVILDSLSHHVDYLSFLIGRLPTEVFCYSGRHSSLEIDVEDVAQILLRFGETTVISIHGNYIQRPYQHTLKLIGENGTATCDLFGRSLKYFTARTRQWTSYHDRAPLNGMYRDQIKHFISCVKGKAAAPVDLEAGINGMRVLMKIKESALKGRWMRVSSFDSAVPKSRSAAPQREKIVGVIQARMGSTRLPGKALKTVLGKPLLWRLYERVKAAGTLDRVVIATAAGSRNRPIVDFAKKYGIECYAGSETDLVDRLAETARKFGATALVRVTGDCPLADPKLIDSTVRFFLANRSRFEYITNAVKPTYPDGLDLDILPLATLERLEKEVRHPFWREWFTSYLREHPKEYRTHNLTHSEDLSDLRWTVDFQEDLDFTSKIFERLYPRKKIFLMHDILRLLKREPGLVEINQMHTRNAAYYKARKEAGK